MLNRPLNRMTVGSQAHAVSVARSYVSGTSSINSLNINQQEGLSTIKVLKDNVRATFLRLSPAPGPTQDPASMHLNSPMPTKPTPLSYHPMGAVNSIKEGD